MPLQMKRDRQTASRFFSPRRETAPCASTGHASGRHRQRRAAAFRARAVGNRDADRFAPHFVAGARDKAVCHSQIKRFDLPASFAAQGKECVSTAARHQCTQHAELLAKKMLASVRRSRTGIIRTVLHTLKSIKKEFYERARNLAPSQICAATFRAADAMHNRMLACLACGAPARHYAIPTIYCARCTILKTTCTPTSLRSSNRR